MYGSAIHVYVMPIKCIILPCGQLSPYSVYDPTRNMHPNTTGWSYGEGSTIASSGLES